MTALPSAPDPELTRTLAHAALATASRPGVAAERIDAALAAGVDVTAPASDPAVRLLLDMLSTHAVQDVRYVLETHLVVRETTAPARAGSTARRADDGPAKAAIAADALPGTAVSSRS